MLAAYSFQRLAGAAVWWVLIIVRWGHATFVQMPMEFFLETVLVNWEEAVKSAVRECFAWMARFLNGLAAQVLKLFVDPQYVHTLRRGRRRPTAWQRWWAERARRGTFNAVLERDGLVVGRASPSPTPSPGGLPRGSLPRASASCDQLLHEQQQRQAEVLLAAERLRGDSGSPRRQPQRQRLLAWLWPFGRWGGAGGARGASPGPSPLPMRRSGSELFDRPSGYAVAEGIPRRGLLEEGRLRLELAVTAAFDATRSLLRTLLFLPRKPKWGAPGAGRGTSAFEGDWRSWERRAAWGRARPRGLRDRLLARSGRGIGRLEDLQVWTASDCILQAGFPLEEHVVATEDGCVLHMQRIPRKGSPDAVFFQHGVLDTSLGWVANGVQGSQAFAAWDAGHDVWLGNARSNPPRMHEDPGLPSGRYWHYSLNQLGMQDVAAQVEHIHAVKCRELRPGGGYAHGAGGLDRGSAEAGAPGLRRTYSDSAVAASHPLSPDAFGEEPEGGMEEEEEAAAQAAAVEEQRQQQASGEPRAPVAERTTGAASMDGGPGLANLRGRAPRMVLTVHVPEAAGHEQAGGQQPAPLQAAAGSAPAGSERPASAAAAAAPSRQRSAPGDAGSSPPPPLARLSSFQESRSGAGGLSSPAVTPRAAAADRQALTPDRFSFRGVEQPAGSQAATTPLLLPLPEAGGHGGGPSPRAGSPTPGPGQHGTAAIAEPYRLRAVGHSLGGASLLIYAVTRALAGRPHHLRRLVLLTPAGFNAQYPAAAAPFVRLLPAVMAALRRLRPGWGLPVYLPSSLLRYVAFKLSYDLQAIPALNELTRAALRLMLSNDSSEWDRALQMPHYNTYGMPAISLHTGAHLVQLIRRRRFLLYDYGSAAANRRQYGQDEPLDVAAHYHLLQGLPVDLVAGGRDGIIPPANVQAHYEAMRGAGLAVTFKQFQAVGHLDLTFAVREEVRRYVVSRLQLP